MSGHQNAASNCAASLVACASSVVGLVVASDAARAARGQALGRVHVTLHFGERDGAFGQSAVGMENRVLRIFPALIGQALLAGAQILYETVAVRIAGTVDPAQRGFDRRPQRGDGLDIAGAFQIKAGEQNEQRR